MGVPHYGNELLGLTCNKLKHVIQNRQKHSRWHYMEKCTLEVEHKNTHAEVILTMCPELIQGHIILDKTSMKIHA